jgi:glycosyltransferase involved in cell wall biosynthesis
VIVVDDGSTDGTREWLKALNSEAVRAVFQENKGAPSARNKGLAHAEGQYIKFLDDDDRLAPDALPREIQALEESAALVSYGAVRIERKQKASYTRIPDEDGDLVMGLMRDRVAAHPHAFLYDREALEGVWWDEDLQYYQDTDFAFRVASHGIPTVRLPETVALHYVHDGDRISDRKQDAPVVEQQRRRVETILRSLRTLEENDALRPGHRVAAAEGIWRWAYMAAPYDFSFFRESVEKAETICPSFRPEREQPVLEWLDRHIGPQQTEALINPLRRAKRYLYA